MEEVKFDKNLAVENAMKLFWEKGFYNTSLKELLSKMKILNGSFYNTYKSKKNVFLMALDKYNEIILMKRIEIFKSKSSFQKGIRAFFYQSIKDYSCQENPNGCLIVNSIEKEILDDYDIESKLKESILKLSSFFEIELNNAQRSGEINAQIDTKITASILTDFSKGLSKSSLIGEEASFMKRKVSYLLKSLSL